MITAETLHRWSERLCYLASGGRAEAAALLEVPSRLVAHHDFALLEPPPEGAVRVQIFDDIASHTVVDYIDLELVPPGIPLAELEARFGPGEAAVRVSATSPYKQWFRVEREGAPCTCDVYAIFASKPAASTPATSFMLRRNPSPAPKR